MVLKTMARIVIDSLREQKDAALETNADQRLLLVTKARWFMIGLLIVHGLLGVGTHLIYNQSPNVFNEIFKMAFYPALVVLFIIAYNTFYHIGWHKLPKIWVPRVKFFILAQLSVDIMAILLLIHYSGGATSWLWPLFLVLNLELTFLLSANWQIVLMGTLAGIGYSVLGILEYNHILSTYPMPYLPKELQYNAPYVISTLFWVNLISSCACFVSIYLHRGEHKELKERIVRDGLTTLYNRRHFNHRLNSEIRRAQRYGRVVSLILFDIDDFKKYNDTYGHVQGDILLQWVSNTIKSNIRRDDRAPTYEIDIACRYGGEEFAIILPETDTDLSIHTAEQIRKEIEIQTSGAVSIAERIRETVETAKFEKERRVTISAGVASFPIDGKNPKEIIEAADKALYSAKESGKNKTVVSYLSRTDSLTEKNQKLTGKKPSKTSLG